MSNTTIFALATPPAKSGVAIIRISGECALASLQSLSGKKDWQPNSARLCHIKNPESGDVIDQTLALYFKAPASFTGEDVVELQIHGSLAIIKEMLELLSKQQGLRHAEAGEFTKRAFLNGKMDLVEAEGLADLIDAETTEQKKLALTQIQGGLSRHYDDLRTRTLKALAHLEAYIDFPEEEIPEEVLSGLDNEVGDIKSLINNMLSDDRRGERIREGLNIVILGAPNAGKSSLLNCLAKREAAIVSQTAGTTRDVIEIHMDIKGFPVVLMDTAGLREGEDDIEEEGVRRSLDRAKLADYKLIMFDGAEQAKDEQSRGLIDDNSLTIINKIDLLKTETTAQNSDYFYISTKTGEGLDKLLSAIEQKIIDGFSGAHAPMITRSRHRALLAEALYHLERFDSSAALELACEELRRAATDIGKITGKIAVDDVLGEIFSEFCIGK